MWVWLWVEDEAFLRVGFCLIFDFGVTIGYGDGDGG